MFNFLLWNSFSHRTLGASRAHSQSLRENETRAHPQGLQLSFAKGRVFGLQAFSSQEVVEGVPSVVTSTSDGAALNLNTNNLEVKPGR